MYHPAALWSPESSLSGHCVTYLWAVCTKSLLLVPGGFWLWWRFPTAWVQVLGLPSPGARGRRKQESPCPVWVAPLPEQPQ